MRLILEIADGTPSRETAIPNILQIAGEACKLSRVYVSLFDGEGGVCSVFEWRAPNIPPCGTVILPAKEEERSQLMRFYDPVDRVFYCSDLEKEGASIPRLREMAAQHGAKAALQCCLGKIGVVGFDENGRPRLWTRAETDFLIALTRLLHLRYWPER